MTSGTAVDEAETGTDIGGGGGEEGVGQLAFEASNVDIDIGIDKTAAEASSSAAAVAVKEGQEAQAWSSEGRCFPPLCFSVFLAAGNFWESSPLHGVIEREIYIV